MFPPKKKSPPFGASPAAKPDLGSPSPVDAPKPAAAEPETPAMEATEDYGAKLVADIEAVGEQHGMDAATSRAAAGAFFRAASECLMSSDEGELAKEAEMPEEQGYGR